MRPLREAFFVFFVLFRGYYCLFFAALRSLREIWFRVLFRGMTTITSDNTRTPISVIGAIIG
ncbi:MAG: hypothetical protein WAM44_18150, partial [Chthoniobacterales bacterium]